MKFIAKHLTLSSGGAKVAIINKKDASALDLHEGDRLHLIHGNKHSHIVLDITENPKMVKENEIGLFKEVSDELGCQNKHMIHVKLAGKPISIQYIKEKLDGKRLNYEKLREITQDIVYERLSDIELSFFVSASYVHGLNEQETVDLTRAMIETGDTLGLKDKIIVDKHCTGGVAGNRTTMIVVPIVAAAGLKIPKTSSRSITSPAGTADTMEILANVDFPIGEMRKIVKNINGCIVWGGAINLAPSDDKIIKVEHPLMIDAEGQMLASILAKKGSVGAKHVLIDIPLGNQTKVKTKAKADHLAKKFIKIGKGLGMKIEVITTDGNEPIGNGIGPSLEAADVLRVLQQTNDRPKDLEKKSLLIAGKMFELCGKCKKGTGLKTAKEILKSGKAYDKMKEIIKAQGGNEKIKPEEIKQAKHSYDLIAKTDCVIRDWNNDLVSRTARMAGAPFDAEAGIFLYAHEGEKVKKGDKILTLYANSKDRLKFAKDFLMKNRVVTLG